jgi:transaldolase
MSLKSLIAGGTKLWLDSIDPELVVKNRAAGATGATSNPIIVSDLLKSGRYDDHIAALMKNGMNDVAIAWQRTDFLVRSAQKVFLPVWIETQKNDGYVSFELDPLLEGPHAPPHAERVEQYVALGKYWSEGHPNRLIKVPATDAGLDSIEALCAAGVNVNVTLIFSQRQYEIARDNMWRGAQQRDSLDDFKSCYSIFISRVDVYTKKHLPQLSAAAQGQVGLINARIMWRANEAFWKDKNLPLQQEMIFASTGVKIEGDPADKYVEALAGSDIQTNPPKTNDEVEKLGKEYSRRVDKMPPQAVLDEVERAVDQQQMEKTLMDEGTAKFAEPHEALLELIAKKRAELK